MTSLDLPDVSFNATNATIGTRRLALKEAGMAISRSTEWEIRLLEMRTKSRANVQQVNIQVSSYFLVQFTYMICWYCCTYVDKHITHTHVMFL